MRYMKKIEVVDAVLWDGTREAFAQIQSFIGSRAIANWQKVPARLTVDGQTIAVNEYAVVHPDGRVSIISAPAFPRIYEACKGQAASFTMPPAASNQVESADPASIRRIVDQVLAERNEDFQKINVATQGGITLDTVQNMVDEAVKRIAEGQAVIQVLSADEVRKIAQEEIAKTATKRGRKPGTKGA